VKISLNIVAFYEIYQKDCFGITSILIIIVNEKKTEKMVDSSNKDENKEEFQWILDKLPI
jgi:hypothetical protein